jgi:hypothetical protein
MEASSTTEEHPASGRVHLVGSVNLPTVDEVFAAVGEGLGDRAVRVPDGEVAERANWTLFGFQQLEAHEAFTDGGPSPFGGHFLRLRDPANAATLEVPPAGYAEHARRSYAAFLARREAGDLPAGARFQVSMPTPFAWVGYVTVEERALVEPVLERATLSDLADILAAIPASDLAIQWDVSNEIGVLEQVEPSHFDNVLEGCAERLARLVDAVPEGVEVGLHLCYGSFEDTHFIEPRDAGQMVELVNAITERAHRPLTFVHVPVPIERDDPAFFEPLTRLRRAGAVQELYLGLVHIEDGLEGSRRRIAAARTAVSDFGVATECGIARQDESEMRPLLALQAASADLT